MWVFLQHFGRFLVAELRLFLSSFARFGRASSRGFLRGLDGGEDDAVAAAAPGAQVPRPAGGAAGGGAAASAVRGACGAGAREAECRGGGQVEGAEGVRPRLAAARGAAQPHQGRGAGLRGRRRRGVGGGVRERRHARRRVSPGDGRVPAVGARLHRFHREHPISFLELDSIVSSNKYCFSMFFISVCSHHASCLTFSRKGFACFKSFLR